jgi:hypothetical protein
MSESSSAPSSLSSSLVLGLSIAAGLGLLGHLVGDAALRVKGLERTVVVKGLSEREVPADTAIWPIRFQDAAGDLSALFDSVQGKNRKVRDFLAGHGLKDAEVTTNPPAVTDLHAQNYGDRSAAPFRFTASSVTTVYSTNVAAVRAAMADAIALGRQGVAITGEDYEQRTQFLFTKLNDLKPGMIAEATQNARAVAGKFAEDSGSSLGAIKTAAQGQFTIEDRDSTTPYIKRVRVVSTVEYFLAD